MILHYPSMFGLNFSISMDFFIGLSSPLWMNLPIDFHFKILTQTAIASARWRGLAARATKMLSFHMESIVPRNSLSDFWGRGLSRINPLAKKLLFPSLI